MKKTIERLKVKFFSSEDDKAWKTWVDLKPRNEKDLIDLLSFDVRVEFKRRAIFLLLVPLNGFNKFYWKGDLGKFNHDPSFLKLISSPAELDYAADLVFDFCSELKFKHIGKSKVSVFGGDGVTFYVPVMEKYHTPLSFYNSCILEFLSLLPEEKARKLFSLFSLLDISTLAKPMAKSGEFDVVFYGHNHIKNKDRINNCLVVNPGEVSGHKNSQTSFVIYDTEKNDADIIDVEGGVFVKNKEVKEYLDDLGFEFSKTKGHQY